METRDPTRMKAANKLRIIVADDHDIVRKGLCYLLARRKESMSIEDSSEVPQVWRLRSEGSWTPHNGSSVNFLGDGRFSGGTARKRLLDRIHTRHCGQLNCNE